MSKRKPVIMVAGPQGDGMRGLHCVLSSFLNTSGRYRRIINYIDFQNASFGEDGGIKGCYDLAAQSDIMIVVLGRDAGRTVTRHDISKCLGADLIQEPQVPFTQMEVAAFLKSRSPALPLYLLVRSELVHADPELKSTPTFEKALTFYRYLQNQGAQTFELGPDLRNILPQLNQRLGLRLDDLCKAFKAKQDYQDHIFHCLRDSHSVEIYLAIVGHWSMLTGWQMDALAKCQLSEMAMIGPEVSRVMLPGFLQRTYVNSIRLQHGLSPISLLLFHGNPPIRFVTLGPQAYIQRANPGEHLTAHLRVYGPQAEALADMFRSLARYCAPAVTHLHALLEGLSQEHIGLSLSSILSSSDVQRRRAIHRKVIDCSAEDSKSALKSVDPNLYELTDEHFAAILPYLRRYVSRARKLSEKQPSYAVHPFMMPDMRIILSSACLFFCLYCPKGNEDFEENVTRPPFDRHAVVPLIAAAAERCGMRSIAITGGEPTLVQGWTAILSEVAARTRCINIQLHTAGIKLASGDTIATIINLASRLRIKLSIDPGHGKSAAAALDVAKELTQQGFPSTAIDINYVCDRRGVEHLAIFLSQFQRINIRAKLLDIVWYADVGNRGGYSSPDTFFKDSRVTMHRVRTLLVEEGYKHIGLLDKGFGIVEEVFQHEKTGHHIRVRDSEQGTTYGKRCVTCPLYADGFCQEGVYQLEVTSDYRLKLCRHRKDLACSLVEAIEKDLGARTTDSIERALRNYITDFYVDVRRESRFRADFHEQSPVIAREISDHQGEGDASLNAALALHAIGARAEAVRRLQEAKTTYDEIKSPRARRARVLLDAWQADQE